MELIKIYNFVVKADGPAVTKIPLFLGAEGIYLHFNNYDHLTNLGLVLISDFIWGSNIK